jgi:predicted metalloprotease with PDZ domain
VRTNHVDDHHALVHGAASFPALDAGRDRACEVAVLGLGPGETSASLLPQVGPDRYRADDHDHLADAAFEAGPLVVHDATIEGVPHRIVWAGHGAAPDLARMASDLDAIAGATCAFLGPVPSARYTLLVVSWQDGAGGLEHRDGAVLEVPAVAAGADRTGGGSDPVRLEGLRSLLAHEYLHQWNVERLAPRGLVRPDLDRPVRSPSLWVAEGWTSYYDLLLPTRAGLVATTRLLVRLSDALQHLEARPGVLLQSLRQASLDAWTKHYVRDENSINAGTDYYTHGAMVALELDLAMRAAGASRARSDGLEGLDAVLRTLWDRHAGGDGYTEQDVLDAIAACGSDELAARIDDRVARPGLPVLDDVVGAVGLVLERVPSERTTELGVVLAPGATGITIRAVLRGRAAWRAGVTGGDEVLAVDGLVVRPTDLGPTLDARGAGTTVVLTVRRGPRLLELPVTLEPCAPRPVLRVDPDAGADAVAAFARWAGGPAA